MYSILVAVNGDVISPPSSHNASSIPLSTNFCKLFREISHLNTHIRCFVAVMVQFLIHIKDSHGAWGTRIFEMELRNSSSSFLSSFQANRPSE